ncbi:MAG: hypothetical protein HN927_09465 [Candidatus Marinimicrobia bacterium]|nr:hypothetical protein [Candidatus Neomarinimicrobiota bacterium]MBT4065132.1 hypothetical protein [Candidatus Neomarinimicrobiota bacterium]MBT4453977.1 hypothetical protein [Candidatus Neomarinimicrobiota bacterium]MBT5386601.1 hypothetical protein [Candidatus Neomarinimicrobiota bacterium]MBT5995160.1 hypothetical protein [Candidatus Neomarinimicrobiota bacterium]
MKFFRNGIVMGTLLCWRVIFSQQIEPSEATKMVLRMKLSMDRTPLIHLDELKSAQMNILHESCINYLDLENQKANDQALSVQARIIKTESEILSQIQYNRKIPEKIKQNIKYNYFSSVIDKD